MINHHAQGVLELHPKGYGFLRNPAKNYAPQAGDAYVSAPVINRLSLREGLLLAGPTEPAKKGSGPRLAEIETIEGKDPEKFKRRNFDDLTPVDPHERIILETTTAIKRAGADILITYYALELAKML